jgi:PAS domain S-box-containing protein
MRKIKVLIVEDETIVAHEIKQFLEKSGYRVSAIVQRGKDAISKAKENSPDLILMDIVLQGELNSIETARQIRAGLDVPVIFITAYSDEKTIAAAKRTDPYGYISKPIDPKQLLISLEIALYKYGAEKKLKERQERLNLFLNPATDIFCLLDSDLKVLEINRSGLGRWGFKEEDILGKSILDFFVLPNEKKKWAEKYKEVLKTGTPIYADEVVGSSSLGEKCISIKALKKGNGLGVIITDITEKRKLEQTLRETQDRYRLLVENMNEGIVMQDENGIITYINEKFLEMRGYTKNEVIGHHVAEFFDENFLKLYQKQLAMRVKGTWTQYETGWKRKNGEKITTIISPQPIYDEKGHFRGSAAVITDITERRHVEEELKRSQEVLRKLGRHLQSIREKESKRIAREIHDELGQALTALKMDVSWISQRLPECGKERTKFIEKISSMSKLIDGTILFVQKISAELRPGLLDDLGLVPAIEWLAQDFQKRSGLKCKVDLSCKDLNINPDCSTAIFRAIQEALINVVRHAMATRVSISIREKAGELELTIKDNGKGITEDDVLSPESLGIIGMRERLYPFEGSLRLQGGEGRGTTLNITIPLKKAKGK